MKSCCCCCCWTERLIISFYVILVRNTLILLLLPWSTTGPASSVPQLLGMISHWVRGTYVWSAFQDFKQTIRLYSVCRGNLESIRSVKQKWTNTEEDPTAQSCLAIFSSRSMWPNYKSNKMKHEYFIMKHLKIISKKLKLKKPPLKPEHIFLLKCWIFSFSLSYFITNFSQQNLLEKGQDQNCRDSGNTLRLTPSFKYKAQVQILFLESNLGLLKLISKNLIVTTKI